MSKNQSELVVFTRVKELCSYIMVATQKSPKHFRYTFTSRLQNISLDIIECVYRANDVFIVKGDIKAQDLRLEFQHRALTNLRILGYFSLLALEQKCILLKQYEIISRYVGDSLNLIGAWINSDKRRY